MDIFKGGTYFIIYFLYRPCHEKPVHHGNYFFIGGGSP